jgi:hypothetical protein
MDDGMNVTDNDCDKIEIGSAFFIFLNSVDPDEVVVFLLEDLPGDLELYLTDNAWNGIEFQTDEGILKVRFFDVIVILFGRLEDADRCACS